jgi:hypothetical protein
MLKRAVIFVHRWLGVALCSVFLLWFPSGIVMMYWDFPSVSAADRLERSPSLDASAISLTPEEAYAALGVASPPTDARLNTFDGRPVYRFRLGRGEALVYADTGQVQQDAPREMRDRIASAWTGQSAGAAQIEPVDAVDQWTLQGPLRTLRPLWKYSWPNGEQAYISETSGEVVQYTTRASRLAAYLGAIPHWLYFTPFRAHQAQWTAVVIWSSGLATLAAILGLVIGVWMFSPSKRYRYAGVPAHTPYRGPKRWHAILGLTFGVAAVTWAFSGMLSMDPFPMASGPSAGRRAGGDGGIPQALRGRFQLTAFGARHPRQALAQIPGLDVKELELTTFAGEPIYLATIAGRQTRIIPVAGDARLEFDREHIAAVITAAAQSTGGAEIRVLDRYDRYYLDRRGNRPLPVILARLNDAEHTRYYIDPRTARVVGTYSARTWVSRWLYHGLHSLDFPWLYDYRPAWDIVVITFMAGGTALCITSLILAWRVVRGLTLSAAARSGYRDAATSSLADRSSSRPRRTPTRR